MKIHIAKKNEDNETRFTIIIIDIDFNCQEIKIPFVRDDYCLLME